VQKCLRLKGSWGINTIAKTTAAVNSTGICTTAKKAGLRFSGCWACQKSGLRWDLARFCGPAFDRHENCFRL